jgi:hypothetical protein
MPANHPEVNEEEMMALLKKAAESSPDQPEVFVAVRQSIVPDWQDGGIRGMVCKVVALEPKNTDVRSLWRRAVADREEGGGEDVQLRTALTQDPKHVPSLHGLFIIALDNHDVATLDLLARIEKAEPDYRELEDLKAVGEEKAGLRSSVPPAGES